MKKIILLAFALLACNDKPGVFGDELQEKANNLSYFKDERTGICYARFYSLKYDTLTYVPCNEEVEKRIALRKEK